YCRSLSMCAILSEWLSITSARLRVQIVLGILESIAGAVILAGIVWLGRRVKTYVDTLNHLSGQVAQLEAKLNDKQLAYPIDPNTTKRRLADVERALQQAREDRTRDSNDVSIRLENLEKERDALQAEVKRLASLIESLQVKPRPFTAEEVTIGPLSLLDAS